MISAKLLRGNLFLPVFNKSQFKSISCPVGKIFYLDQTKRSFSILQKTTIPAQKPILKENKYWTHHISEEPVVEKVVGRFHDPKVHSSQQDSSKVVKQDVSNNYERDILIVQNQLCTIIDTTKEILEAMKADRMEKENIHAIQLNKAGKIIAVNI